MKPSIRLNLKLNGVPAKWLLEWKRLGLVNSNRDAVVQAFRVLCTQLLELQIRETRLEETKVEETYYD